MQWLAASRNTQKRCELCGSRFSFTPVYRSDAPARLTVKDLLRGLRDKMAGSLPLIVRGLTLATLWLGLLPLGTWLVFQAYFCTSWEELRKDLHAALRDEHGDDDLAKAVVVAGFGGGAVCTAIVIISLIALNVREALLTHLPLRPLLAVMEGRRPREARRRRREEQDGGAGVVVEEEEERRREQQREEDGDDSDGEGADDDEGGDDDEDEDEDEDDIIVVNNRDDDVQLDPAPLNLGVGLLLLDGEDDGAPQQLGDPWVDLQQLLGFHVPLREAVRRWGRFYLYNLGFLTLFQLLPYQLGVQAWMWAQELHPSPVTSLLEYTKALGEMMLVGEMEALLSRGVRSALTEGLSHLERDGRLSGSGPQPSPELRDRLVFLGLGYCILLFILVLACVMLLVTFALRHPRRVVRSARHLEKAWTDLLAYVKLGVLYMLDALVVPQLLGWAIDLSTIGLMNATVRDRLAFLEEWPFPSTMLHWLYGFLFIVASSILSTELRRVLHPDVLTHVLPQPHGAVGPELFLDLEPLPPFVADVDGAPGAMTARRSMGEHLRHMLRSLLIHVTLLMLAIYLPAHFGHTCLVVLRLPPLRLRLSSASHSFIDFHFPLELLLFHVAMPIILERFHLRDAIRWIFEKPFVMATRAVGLGDHILDVDYLPRPQPAPGRAEGDDADGQSNMNSSSSSNERAPRPSHCAFRVFTLTLLTSYSTFLLSSLLLHIPVRIGRVFLMAFGAPNHNDVYNAGIGLLAVWGVGALTHWLVNYVVAHWPVPVAAPPAQAPPVVQAPDGVAAPPAPAAAAATASMAAQPTPAQPTGHVHLLLPLACRLLLKLAQVLVLASLWLLVIPLVLGLVFEVMLIVPVRVPLNETPFVSPLEAWALGLVFLKIWLRCVFLGVLGADNVWRRRFERVRINGFRNLDFRWTLQEVVLPVGMALGDLLFTPHFLVKTTEILLSQPPVRAALAGALTVLGPVTATLADQYIELGLALAKRTAWLSYLGAKLAIRAHEFAGRAMKRLHDRIRDEQYLVGLELKNLHPESAAGVRA